MGLNLFKTLIKPEILLANSSVVKAVLFKIWYKSCFKTLTNPQILLKISSQSQEGFEPALKPSYNLVRSFNRH